MKASARSWGGQLGGRRGPVTQNRVRKSFRGLAVVGAIAATLMALGAPAKAWTVTRYDGVGRLGIPSPVIYCGQRQIYVGTNTVQAKHTVWTGSVRSVVRYYHWERRSNGSLGWVHRFTGAPQWQEPVVDGVWTGLPAEEWLNNPPSGSWMVTLSVDWYNPQRTYLGSTVVNFNHATDYMGPLSQLEFELLLLPLNTTAPNNAPSLGSYRDSFACTARA
jgi:hypothetical protein